MMKRKNIPPLTIAMLLTAAMLLTGAQSRIVASEIHQLHLRQAVPLQVRSTVSIFPEKPISNVDLIVRLRLIDGHLQSYGWAHLPDLPGNQYLVRIAEESSYPNDLRFTLKMHPKKMVAGTNKPVDLSGQITVAVTNLERFDVTGQPEQDSAIIDRYTQGFDFGPQPAKSRRRIETLAKTALATLADASRSGQVTHEIIRGPRNVPDRPGSAEHPRLLFTAADLPRLRQVIATPAGQYFYNLLKEQLEAAEERGFGKQGMPGNSQALWAVGYGFMYQLTEERHYAEQAAELVWTSMTAALADGQQQQQATRILGTALAYDLCYHGWDAEIRRQTYHFLLRQAIHFANRRDIIDPLDFGMRYDYQGETVPRPRSQQAANFHRFVIAAAMGAEAIRHDPPPTLAVPSVADIPHIEPATDYQPPIGVPIVQLRGEEMFSAWLANGPFAATDPDPLAAVGGFGLRPAPTDRVESQGIAVDWRIYRPSSTPRGPALYPRNDMRYFTSSTGAGYPPGLKIRRLLREKGDNPRDQAVALTWYTVWDNPYDRVIMAQPNWHWPSRHIRMFVNGTEVRDGDVFSVKPGLYPVMCWVPVRGGYNLQAPHLREVSLEELSAANEPAPAYQGLRLDGGDDPQSSLVPFLAEALHEQVRIHLEQRLDTAGFGYEDTHDFALPWYLSLRNARGEDWLSGTGYDKLPHALAVTGPYNNLKATARALKYLALRAEESRDAAAIAYLQTEVDAYFAAHIAREQERDRKRALERGKEPSDISPHVFDRPHELVAFLAMLPEQPIAPGDLTHLPSVVEQESVSVIARSTERHGDGDLVVAVHKGHGTAGNRLESMQIAMLGKDAQGRRQRGFLRDTFFTTTRNRNVIDYAASAPRIANMVPAAPAETLHFETGADGAFAQTLLVNTWNEIKPNKNGKDQEYLVRSDHEQRLQRSLFVDFPGKFTENDGPALAAVVIVIDTYTGFTSTTKKWQQWYGGRNTGHDNMKAELNRSQIRLFRDANMVTIRDKRVLPKKQWGEENLANYYYLAGKFFSDDEINLRLAKSTGNGQESCLRVELGASAQRNIPSESQATGGLW